MMKSQNASGRTSVNNYVQRPQVSTQPQTRRAYNAQSASMGPMQHRNLTLKQLKDTI